MVAVQRGLLLTPELRSVFDYTIIDPNSLLVELDKLAALGDSLYIFAISLLLYRVIRQRSSKPAPRGLKRSVQANTGTEGTQQLSELSVVQTSSPPPYHVPVNLTPHPARSFIPYNFVLKLSETPNPEISLTSAFVDFATPDNHNNGNAQSSVVELTECDAHDDSINRALAVGVGGQRAIDNGADNDLNIYDSNADISLTTATFHLVVLLARTLDSSHSATHPTLFRRLIVKYEYNVTLLTVVVVLLRCRKRLTSSRFKHAIIHSFVHYIFPAFWFAICATHHPWILYPSYHLQFVAWTIAPHPSSPNSEPWSWDSAQLACTPSLPYCRVLWTFAHALAAVAEIPQLLKLYEVGGKHARVGRLSLHDDSPEDGAKVEDIERDEGVMAYVSLVALSKFFYLPSYVSIFVLTKMYDPVLYLSQLLHVSIFGVFIIAMWCQGRCLDKRVRSSGPVDYEPRVGTDTEKQTRRCE